MHWSLYILCALLALPVLFFVFGLFHLYSSRRTAERAILSIELADIQPLASECQDVFREKLGVTLTMDSLDEAAEQLEQAFKDSYQLKEAFARDDCYWYFVKPV